MPERRPSLAEARRVHLVGIGGSGMSALAELLLAMGKEVTGSDVADSRAVDALRDAGASVRSGHAAEHLGDAEYVIRSAAVPLDNPEVAEAERRGLPSVKLAEAVGELMRDRGGVGVAGTHGKSTTTALVAWLLEQGGEDPLVLVGAESVNLGGSARLGSGPMVVEADEYDRRFLALAPEVAVVTSVEPDHLDYFHDLAEIAATFQQFVDRLPPHGRLVVCQDDEGARALRTDADRVTYGFAADADWRATDYAALPGGGGRFRVHNGGRSWTVETALLGEHNVCNALAALAVADYFGVGLQSALTALPRFQGTRRRFESHGRPGGVWLVDDYAHHPTAVAATLEAARSALPEDARLWVVFQPHTTSRTTALLDAFAGAFRAADHALVLPVYHPSGREKDTAGATSEDLVARIRAAGHPDSRFVPDFDAAEAALREGVRPSDLAITMGAGDVTRLATRLERSLGADR